MSFAEAQEAVSHMAAIESTEEMGRWVKKLNRRMAGEVLDRLSIKIDV
jgi:hypothetical protein